MKKIIAVLLFMTAGLQALAQQEQLFYIGPDSVTQKVKTFIIENENYAQWVDSARFEGRSKYVTNKFFDNWFITVGGMAQVYNGDQDSKGSFSSRITPAWEVGLGKWILPAYGVRAMVSGGDAIGYADYPGAAFIKSGPDSKGLYKQQFSQIMVHGDLVIDLNNAIGGYRPERFYTLVPFVGAGISFVTGLSGSRATDRTAVFVAGLQNRFRLSPALDANIEFKIATVDGDYDHEVVSRPWFEGFYQAGVSLTWRIGAAGKRPFKRTGNTTTYLTRLYRPETQVTVVKETVIEERVREVPATATAAASASAFADIPEMSMAIFFDLNKDVITPNNKVNVAFAADMIKRSQGVRFRLEGMADSHTGNVALNQDLSRRRAEAVRRMLVEEFGVPAEKLVPQALGGVAYRDPQYVNRVVLIIPEK